MQLSKPKLNPSNPNHNLVAFNWNPINIDSMCGSNKVISKDLSDLDPEWEDKPVIWKDVQENQTVDMDMVNSLFQIEQNEEKEVRDYDYKESETSGFKL